MKMFVYQIRYVLSRSFAYYRLQITEEILCNIDESISWSGFGSQLEASNVSSHTDELWYNETVRLCMTIDMLPPMGPEHFSKGIISCNSLNASF